jgi:hypothetical protein
MSIMWEKPEFLALSVNGECTAYSGTEETDSVDLRVRSAERSPCTVEEPPSQTVVASFSAQERLM